MVLLGMDLKGENYRAWQVKPEDFPISGSLTEQLKFLLNFAVLAPSTHNSQPWNFKIAKNQIIIVNLSGRGDKDLEAVRSIYEK